MSGTTPSSGQISLNNLQSVFGGTNPINFSEYYLNASTGYTAGVSGIPNIGTQIALSNFYGKTKPVVSSYPPAQQTNQGNFGLPVGVGTTNYEWLTGAVGINLTTPGGSTFYNKGVYGQYRPSFINNQNLILQAKPGDTLRFEVQNGALYPTPEVNSIFLNLGAGWLLVQAVNGTGGHTATINYTLPTNVPPGNYAIVAYNNYSYVGYSSYASANFYSLHVVA